MQRTSAFDIHRIFLLSSIWEALIPTGVEKGVSGHFFDEGYPQQHWSTQLQDFDDDDNLEEKAKGAR